MNKKIRFFFIPVIICLIIFLFLSCTNKKLDTNTVTIRYFTRATAEQLDIWKEAVGKFEKQNPDIKVEIENVAYQAYWEKILTMIAGGESPDLVFMESRRLPAFVIRNGITPMDELIKQDKDIKLNDFYAIALESCKMNGRLYGLPNDIAVVVLFYNKDMFDQEGVPYPKDGWTWDDFIKTGQLLTKDKNNNGTIDQYGIATYAWKCAIWQNGGDLIDDPDNPKKSTMNTPASREALQFCHDLVYKYKIAPPSTWWQSQQGHEMFTTQKIAMTIEGHWMVPFFRKSSINWDVVTLPKKKKHAGENYGSCFSIPAGSKHVREAWRLAKFLAGKEGQEIIVRSGFSTPALISAANSKDFLSHPKNAIAFLKMLQRGHLSIKTPHALKIENIYQVEMDQFWLNKIPVNEMARNVDKAVNKVLKDTIED